MKKDKFESLDSDQKAWIEKKVKELGSYKAVQKFYNKEDVLVDQYALHLAEDEFPFKRTT
jgi:hypothetical protein